MRTYLPAALAAFALSLAGTAFAAEPVTQQDQTPSPISYSSNDGLECHHIVHEGQLTSIVECRDHAGWERQRHMMTQQTILEMQIHSNIQRN